LPKSIIKSHAEKKGGHDPGKLPKIWSFPFNIYIMAEASDFKFGTQFGFAKIHHIITPRGNNVGGLGLREFSKILGFPIIFLQQLRLATSNLARICGSPRPIIKSHAKVREGMALG